MEEIKKLVKPYFVEWQTEMEITAVLKYINNSLYVKEIVVWNKEISILIQQDWKYWSEFILNKPLHLYTDQEKKDLLKLLLKLKD